jgi:hypothetical protein
MISMKLFPNSSYLTSCMLGRIDLVKWKVKKLLHIISFSSLVILNNLPHLQELLHMC